MKNKRIVFVFLGCTLMYGALMGLLYNCAGVVISGIINAEGYTSSSISGFYTLRALVSAFMVIVVAKLIQKVNVKYVAIGVGICCSLAYFLMFFYTQPWQWMISGVLSSVGGSPALLLSNTVIRAWFTKRRGTAIGFVTMTSGLFGALFNPVVSRLIESFGWRHTVLILGGVALTTIVLSSLLIVRRPSDVGAQPYGGEEEQPAARIASPHTKAPLQIGLYIFLFFTVSMAGMSVQTTSYIPQYSSSLGHPLTVGATLTSMIMIGNLSGKLLFGLISDRIGVWKTVQIFHSLIGLSFIIFIFFSRNLVMIHIASLLLGASYITGISMPLACGDVFAPEHFEDQYSRCSMISSLVSAFVPYFMSFVYDTTGSFRLGFAFFVGLAAASVALICFKGRVTGSKVKAMQ